MLMAVKKAIKHTPTSAERVLYRPIYSAPSGMSAAASKTGGGGGVSVDSNAAASGNRVLYRPIYSAPSGMSAAASKTGGGGGGTALADAIRGLRDNTVKYIE